MRYFDDKHIKRSTKTPVKRDAIAFAKKFYEQLIVNKHNNIANPTRKSSFVTCAEEMMDEDLRKVQRKELSESYVKNAKSLIKGVIVPYFTKYSVTDISYAVLDQFRTHLTERDLAASSIKIYMIAVKKILDHAQRMDYLKTTPLSPKVKAEDNARGYFKAKEYRKLRTAARKLIGSVTEVKQNVTKNGKTHVKKLRNIVVEEQLHLLIGFMVYSFIRPTDLKQIKHKHIEIWKAEEGEYLFMPIPASKKHNKPITSMPRAAKFYKALKKLRLTQIGNESADISDEYLFSPTHLNRNYAYQTIARQFDVVLDHTNMKTSEDGDTRSLYSLRHTSLMFRIQYGGEINPLKLANNARTSVEMLERFYLSKMETPNSPATFTPKSPAKSTSANAPRSRLPLLLPGTRALRERISQSSPLPNEMETPTRW